MSNAIARTIRPNGSGLVANLVEAWQRRDLVYSLVRRDLAVRYKQSVLGVAWAILQPVAMMLIFTAVFSHIARVPSPTGAPYHLQVFSALLVWQLFSASVSRGSTSIVTSSSLISKVYFPRLIVPLAAVLVPIVDFLISLAFFFMLLLYDGRALGPTLLFLPIVVLLTVLVSTGLSLWLTSLHVKYRDVALLIPLALQIGMYATPVIYSADLVPKSWLQVFQLNPLVTIVEGAKWATLGQGSSEVTGLAQLAYCTTSAVMIFLFGLWYFDSAQGSFTDVV